MRSNLNDCCKITNYLNVGSVKWRILRSVTGFMRLVSYWSTQSQGSGPKIPSLPPLCHRDTANESGLVWLNYISLSLTMNQSHEEPNHSEQEPRKEKRGGKTEDGPVPRSSNH